MRLTRASSYALHAVIWMAGQKTNAPAASHRIAKDRKIPERFLLKVLKPLVTAQILTSVKGPHGGYRLARPANKISVLAIIEAVDGPIRGEIATWNGGGVTAADKQLAAIAEEAAAGVRRAWERKTIEGLVAGKR